MRLGAYPSDAYFDPARPAWLPYWIDTPAESALKWGAYPGVKDLKTPLEQAYPRPPAPASPGAPPLNRAIRYGDWTPEDALGAGWEQTQRLWRDFFAAVDDKNRPEEPNATWLWIALGVAAVSGLLLFVRR